MSSGTSENFADVWGSSGSDIFAVGTNGTILHYDGTSWSSMASPTTYRLSGVWGSSGSDVFASGSYGIIIHYNGTSWSSMASPTSLFLFDIWGSSGSDVFAVGEQGIIFHYNGANWSPMDSPTIQWLARLWGSSGSDVFAVGREGTIIHYNGSDWIPMTSGTSKFLTGIWDNSGSDIFAVGADGTILHYNGTDWTPMVSGTSVTLQDVWGNSGSDVFAVGEEGTILHYNGTDWTPMVSGTSGTLIGVWGSSGSNVFAVGANGTILRYDGVECTANADCDDGKYCNGIETCDSGSETCLPGIPVDCPAGQTCNEDNDQCMVPPPCTVTIIPSAATVFSWETFQFGTTTDGACEEPCYTWEISSMGCTGSTIGPATGIYTAGEPLSGNTCNDTVHVTDPCNGDIADTAMVNVIASCMPDIYEPDAIPPLANPIIPNSCQPHNICPIGDHDWVEFELASASGVILETFGPEGDTVLCLSNSSGNLIACDDDGGPGAFSYIQQPCLPAGTYYLEIWGFADFSEIPEYEICVTLTPCPPPVELDCTKLLASSQFGELFRIDVTTGEAELIGYMPGGLATEIEYDVLTGILYAEEVDGLVNIHTIDPTTAISLGFVPHEYASLNGLEFVGSTLYGTHIPGGGAPSDLVIVDTATGNLTHIGPTGYGPISGLAYDKGASVMYGITAGGVPANLVTIDLSTGAATVVGPTGLNRIGSIEFGPDGNLYGGVTAFGSSLATYLVRIDTTTGAVTPIGETGYSITGLTNCGAGDGCIVSCREDESGSLNIVETTGRSGSQVTATVEINSAPNLVDALGFDVTYDPDCLEYTGDWQPGSCIAFWSFSFIEVTNPAPGVVRFGGFTVLDPVQRGISCDVVKLPFTVVTPELDSPGEAIRLDLQELVDDVAGWSASPGFICGGCSCDINENGIVTPQDALCAFQKYLEICPTSCGPCDAICGNINGDDQCTPADALCIFQEYLGIGCDHCT
jgi:hypothetical protein